MSVSYLVTVRINKTKGCYWKLFYYKIIGLLAIQCTGALNLLIINEY